MPLSASLIVKFQQTYLEEYGYAISAEVAESELLGLAELIEITAYTHSPAEDDLENGKVNEA